MDNALATLNRESEAEWADPNDNVARRLHAGFTPVRPTHGGGSAAPARTAPTKALATNIYPGNCTACGGRVEAEAGTRAKVAGRWTVAHLEGQCPQVVAQAAQAPAVRSNLYGQPCGNCKVFVPAGEGVLEGERGHWVVWHREGECPSADKLATDGTVVPGGRYAFHVEGVCKFYVLDIEGVHAQASGDLWPVTTKAQEVIDRIATDIEECARTYGRELGQCCKCNRKLTSEWRKQGIGPICAEKAGW